VGGAGLGGAGAVLIAWDQAGADRLQCVGLGGGQRFQRFALRRRDRIALRCVLLCARLVRCKRRPRNGCSAGGSDLPEQAATRYTTRRVVI